MKECLNIDYTVTIDSYFGYKFGVVDILGYDFFGRACATAGCHAKVSRVYQKPRCNYIVKFVKIRKSELERFKSVMKEVERLMFVTGHLNKNELRECLPFINIPE